VQQQRAREERAPEREASIFQTAAEKEEKRILKEAERETKKRAAERVKQAKEAARLAKKAGKAKKSGKRTREEEEEKEENPMHVVTDVDPNMHQLVLYDDKRCKVIEAVENSIKVEKGRRLKWRKIKDWSSYRKGRTDAEKVHIGTKALPAPVGSKRKE
jgi:hypothetical protein